jgi:hypothetical protein
MQIWNHHPTTGELIGSSRADPNPMEAGEWLIPAHATSVMPPECEGGHVAVFVGSSWTCAPDHRGETWWEAGAAVNPAARVVTEIGDPTAFAPPLTNIEPPAPAMAALVVASARQIRQALNLAGLRVAFEAWVRAADQDTTDNWQFSAWFVQGNSMLEAAADAGVLTTEAVGEVFTIAKSL